MRILNDEELQDFVDFFNKYKDLRLMVRCKDDMNALTDIWSWEKTQDGKLQSKCCKVIQVRRLSPEDDWEVV